MLAKHTANATLSPQVAKEIHLDFDAGSQVENNDDKDRMRGIRESIGKAMGANNVVIRNTDDEELSRVESPPDTERSGFVGTAQDEKETQMLLSSNNTGML